MSKSKKENVETEPQLEVEDDFEAEENSGEDIPILEDDPKLKNSTTKQVYESRRKLEDLLAEKKRQKEQSYDFEEDDE